MNKFMDFVITIHLHNAFHCRCFYTNLLYMPSQNICCVSMLLGMCQLLAGCICSHCGYRLICITFIGRAVVIKAEYFALVCALCLEQLSDKTRMRPLGTCKSKAHVKVCIVPSECQFAGLVHSACCVTHILQFCT